jgi:hypothetical protein
MQAIVSALHAIVSALHAPGLYGALTAHCIGSSAG